MQHPIDTTAHRITASCKAPGTWSLPAGQAITLRPDTPGELRIMQGCVWLTLDGPHESRAGDLFLAAPAWLRLGAGHRVVLEPVAWAGASGAAIDWVPTHQPAAWRVAVAQPAADLRRAAGAAALSVRAVVGALLRLAGALLGLVPEGLVFAAGLVARRDRATAGTFALRAHSSASRAQGCIKAGDSIASSGAL